MQVTSGMCSISRHGLSAAAATVGKPKVAASPLISMSGVEQCSLVGRGEAVFADFAARLVESIAFGIHPGFELR
jgi:hypothetical protein